MDYKVVKTFLGLTLLAFLTTLFVKYTYKSTYVFHLKSFLTKTTQSHSFAFSHPAPQPAIIKQANMVKDIRNRTAERHPPGNATKPRAKPPTPRNTAKPRAKPPTPRNAAKPRAEPLTEAARLKQYIGSPCHKLSFAHPSLPVTALASFPGSGNTWLRHLIEEATGLATGAVYPEPEVLRDFPGGGIADGRVVVVKTHLTNLGIGNLSRAIILIRNPFTALISWFNWLWERQRTKGSRDTAWKKHVVEEINVWFKDYNAWLKLPKPKLVVVYEDLKRDTRREMRRITQFLNITLTEGEVECMMKNSEGKFHRKPYDSSLYPFTEDATKIIRTHASHVNKLLLQNNLNRTIEDKLPTV